jgi:hypothetical protein
MCLRNQAEKRLDRPALVLSGNPGHIPCMPNRASRFICPLCEAEFKVVRVEAGAEIPEGSVVFCPACQTPFPGREGPAVLKYFLVVEPAFA